MYRQRSAIGIHVSPNGYKGVRYNGHSLPAVVAPRLAVSSRDAAIVRGAHGHRPVQRRVMWHYV